MSARLLPPDLWLPVSDLAVGAICTRCGYRLWWVEDFGGSGDVRTALLALSNLPAETGLTERRRRLLRTRRGAHAVDDLRFLGHGRLSRLSQ